MKVVILAGGFGTRITEESQYKPKPMIEIGGKPILIHIMEYYASFGHKDFIICAGYKKDVIKDYFVNMDIKDAKAVKYAGGRCMALDSSNAKSDWKVTVVDTGVGTLTGGRLSQIYPYLEPCESFLLTYGDGLSDVDINKAIEFHFKKQATVTMTGIKPDSRYGVLNIGDNDKVNSFREKSQEDADWINGGFMVVRPDALSYVEGDVMFEGKPLEDIANAGGLYCFKHEGHWQCMDTLRDKQKLEAEWESGNPFWKRG